MIASSIGAGLPAFALSQQHLHRAVLTYALRIGPRYEAEGTAGISHFLEHMLHRGTKRLPTAHAQAVAVEALGGSLDAMTGVDHGTLTLTCPPESFEAAAELLGEIVAAPIFSEIDVERGIVREELLEDRDERGRLIDPDGVARNALFGDHPLGFPIVGTLRTLASFDESLLRRHHTRHYTTASAVVTAAGRLPPKARLSKILSRAFAAQPPGKPVRAPAFRRAPTAPSLRVVRSPASQVAVRVACLGPGRRHTSEAATELLLRVIDDGTSTRLYETLCDRLGLCYEVSAAWEAYDEVGLFDIAAEAQDEAVPRVLEELFSMMRSLADRGPTPAEIDKALKRSRWLAERAQDQPELAAEELATSALTGAPRSPAEKHRRIASLTAADVKRAARRVFDPRRVTVALVGPVSRASERRARTLLGLD
ncbi:MAG: insulinase family protein [Polyangiaceae bacterium]|nr:insulinase family protein [Polyangiaceae bacterium]